MKLDNAHKEIIKQEVAQAKQLSDIVIVSVHWGNELHMLSIVNKKN